jgi:hypothetical protein
MAGDAGFFRRDICAEMKCQEAAFSGDGQKVYALAGRIDTGRDTARVGAPMIIRSITAVSPAILIRARC